MSSNPPNPESKCRTCLAQSQVMIPITALSIASGNTLKILDVFMTCASVRIEPDDGYSQFACSECVISAEKAYTFRKQCEKVDSLWHSSIIPVKDEVLFAEDSDVFHKNEPENFEVKSIKKENEIEISKDDIEYTTQTSVGCKDNENHIDKEPADRKKSMCDICGQLLRSERCLKVHKASMHSAKKNYVCQYCGKAFVISTNLGIHVRTHHTGEKPYSCNICGAKYSQTASLRYHKYTHTKEKLFACELCHMRFRHKNALAAHRKTHMGTKPYKCNVCWKRFTASSSVKKHMLIHTGEKNYVCPDCGKAFITGFHLKVHKQVHTGEKPHVCSECGKGFSQAHCLRGHMRSIHHKKVQAEKHKETIA